MVSRAAAVLALALAGGAAHPLHTSVTEVSSDAGGTVRVAIRLYADDLGSAAGTPAALPPDSAVARMSVAALPCATAPTAQCCCDGMD